MPDEKPETTPETPKEPDSPPSWVKDLATGIGKEVAKNVSAAREEHRQAPQPEAAEPQPFAEEDIIAAISSGDTARSSQMLRHNDAVKERRLRREFGQQFNQGAAVLSELSENSIAGDEDAKPYLSEIRDEIRKFQDNNPGVLVTPQHWRYCKEIILGRHAKDIREGAREASIRRLREGGLNINADGTIGRDNPEHQPEDDITELAEKGSRFDEAFRQKSRAHGGRGADEEVRVMGRLSHRLAGDYDAEASKLQGRPVFRKTTYANGIKDLYREREAMKRFAEEHPTLGLDE